MCLGRFLVRHGGRRAVWPLWAVAAVPLSFGASATASGFTALHANAHEGQITGAQIKDGAVLSRHIGNGSVTGRDVRDGSLRRADFAAGKVVGPRGFPGSPGIHGLPGGIGPPGAVGLEYRPATTDFAPNSSEDLVSMCSSASKVVVGGGVGATDADEVQMGNSNPVLVGGVWGWHATATSGFDSNGQPNTLRVWAICVDGPH
jgi:hypothetical protein